MSAPVRPIGYDHSARPSAGRIGALAPLLYTDGNMRPPSTPGQPVPRLDIRDPAFPQWSAADGAAFRDLVAAALAERGHRVAVDGDTVRWPASAAGRNPALAAATANLQDLARRCAADPRGPAGWPDLVAAQLGSPGASTQAPDLPDGPSPEEFYSALRLRLVAEDSVDAADGFDTGEAFAAGVRAVFVLDLPHGVARVPDTLLDRHGGARALRATALHNTLTREHPDACISIRADPADDLPLGSFLQLSGRSQYVASLALDLIGCARAVGVEPGPDGLFFALPSRNLLLIHAIRDAACEDSMNALALRAIRAYQQAPGPITPNAFWWHDGLIEVVSRYADEEQTWSVSDGLDAILARLADAPTGF